MQNMYILRHGYLVCYVSRIHHIYYTQDMKYHEA